MEANGNDMFGTIRNRLEALHPEAWELTEVMEERWEFYFIRHRLDQNRAVSVREYEVRIYMAGDDGRSIGSASDVISPTASEEEIGQTLEKLCFEAGLVKNPYYTVTDVQPDLSDFPAASAEAASAAGIRDTAERYIHTLAEIRESGGRSINSYEIFVSGIHKRMCNSNGVCIEFAYPSSEIEVVINASEGKHEIELHRIYDAGTCDPEKLRSDIEKVMQYGTDRLHAVPTPAIGRGSVLLSTADSAAVYNYFADKMTADLVYRKLSDFRPGQPVSGEMQGDRLTLEALSFLPGSSMNVPVDREGNAVFDRYLIRDGIAEQYCGSRQFSQYLGLEKSSMITNLRASGGSLPESALRDTGTEGDYLEIVEFSDFQVDSFSGDIAGEIRLGYLHRGSDVTIVTGGSISGSMHEAVKTMRFSRETVQYDSRIVPSVTLLKGMRITGVAEQA